MKIRNNVQEEGLQSGSYIKIVCGVTMKSIELFCFNFCASIVSSSAITNKSYALSN